MPTVVVNYDKQTAQQKENTIIGMLVFVYTQNVHIKANRFLQNLSILQEDASTKSFRFNNNQAKSHQIVI